MSLNGAFQPVSVEEWRVGVGQFNNYPGSVRPDSAASSLEFEIVALPVPITPALETAAFRVCTHDRRQLVRKFCSQTRESYSVSAGLGALGQIVVIAEFLLGHSPTVVQKHQSRSRRVNLERNRGATGIQGVGNCLHYDRLFKGMGVHAGHIVEKVPCVYSTNAFL